MPQSLKKSTPWWQRSTELPRVGHCELEEGLILDIVGPGNCKASHQAETQVTELKWKSGSRFRTQHSEQQTQPSPNSQQWTYFSIHISPVGYKWIRNTFPGWIQECLCWKEYRIKTQFIKWAGLKEPLTALGFQQKGLWFLCQGYLTVDLQ